MTIRYYKDWKDGRCFKALTDSSKKQKKAMMVNQLSVTCFRCGGNDHFLASSPRKSENKTFSKSLSISYHNNFAHNACDRWTNFNPYKENKLKEKAYKRKKKTKKEVIGGSTEKKNLRSFKHL